MPLSLSEHNFNRTYTFGNFSGLMLYVFQRFGHTKLFPRYIDMYIVVDKNLVSFFLFFNINLFVLIGG